MKWTIGDIEVYQIVEMEGGELIQSTIPQATPENIKKITWLYPHFADEKGNLKALVQSFLIKSNGKNILIDTCNGNEKNRPTAPTWGNLHTDFLRRFSEIGIKETDINMVIFTHLHFDHVGWNTYLENAKWIPTFPNAIYLFVREEYDYWKQKPEKELDDDKFGFDDSVTPIVEAGLAQFVESNYRVDDNICLLPSPGHTPGHVSIMIASQGKQAIISGDFFHHPCQIAHPEWTMDADTSPNIALETRKKMLEEIADTDTILIGSHFPNPVAGKVKRYNNSYILT